VLFALMYLLLRRLVRLLANSYNDLNSDVEVVVLRHQADGPQAPRGSSASSPSRPAVPGRDEQDASSGSMVLVRGQPTDTASLAPGVGEKEMDLQTDLRGRQAPDQRGGPGPDPSDGEGEPQVGVHPDPGRAAETRRPGVCHEDPHPGASDRPRSGSQAIGSHLERVLVRPGPRDPGAGFLHRGDGVASHALRALCDRGRVPSRARPRSHQEPRLSVGHPASAKSGSGRSAWRPPVPHPRPGFQVHRSVRRGVPLRGGVGHTDTGPSPASERLRRAVGPNGPDRVPGLDGGLRPPPPGKGASGLHLSIQRPKAASGPRPEDARAAASSGSLSGRSGPCPKA
jgi:hypothetical protein